MHKPTTENYAEDAKSVVIKECFIGEKYVDDTIWYLHYPSAVWAEVAGRQFLEFGKEENLSHSVWKSSTSIFRPSGNSNRREDVPVSCLIWIKFHHHSGQKKSLEAFKDMFVSQSHCDVQFCFDGGKQIGGHATILCARSSVFAAMFQNGMRKTKTKQAVIKDFEPEIFKEFLSYLYVGRILSKFTETTAKSLLLLADMYDIEDLKDECLRFIKSGIRTENAIDLLVWAHLHAADEVCNLFVNNTTQNGYICNSYSDPTDERSNPQLNAVLREKDRRITTMGDAYERIPGAERAGYSKHDA